MRTCSSTCWCLFSASGNIKRAKKKLRYLCKVREGFIATNSRIILDEWEKIILIFTRLERRLTFSRLVDNKIVYLKTNELKNIGVNV